MSESETTGTFGARHIGPDGPERQTMLAAVGFDSLDVLVDAAVPSSIRDAGALDLTPPRSEAEATAELRALAARNTVCTSLIGLGYYDTITPPVIQRNILENPAGTRPTRRTRRRSPGPARGAAQFPDDGRRPDRAARRERVAARRGDRRGRGDDHAARARQPEGAASVFLVRRRRAAADDRRRAHARRAAGHRSRRRRRSPRVRRGTTACFGALLQYPDTSGARHAICATFIETATARGVRGRRRDRSARAHARSSRRASSARTSRSARPSVSACRSATADRTRASSRYGRAAAAAAGPARRRLARRAGQARVAARAADARAAHPPREGDEQHLHRAGLLAVIAGLYAVYHGAGRPARHRAPRARMTAALLAAAVGRAGLPVGHEHFFDTVAVRSPGHAECAGRCGAGRAASTFAYVDADTVAIAFDETVTPRVLSDLLHAFGVPSRSKRRRRARSRCGVL